MGLMKLCSVEGKAGDIEGTEYDRRGGVPCVAIHGEHSGTGLVISDLEDK